MGPVDSSFDNTLLSLRSPFAIASGNLALAGLDYSLALEHVILFLGRMSHMQRFSLLLCLSLSFVLTACEDGLKPDEVPEEACVLVRMTQWQEPWFAKKMEDWPGAERLEDWPGAEKLEVETISYQALEELPSILRERRDAKADLPCLIAKIEGRILPRLIEEELIIPLEDILPKEELENFLLQLDPRALEPALVGGKTWALPRKIENHIFAYRSFYVRQAALYWKSMAGDIEEIFRSENGVGLPKNYELESDPAM